MQTLANLSSSRDVLKQVEINQSSLLRLVDFYKPYRDALDFQLTRRAPEMIEALNAMNNTAPGAGGSNGSFSAPGGTPAAATVNTSATSSPPPVPFAAQKSFIRRRSVRQSHRGENLFGAGGGPPAPSEAVSQAVVQLKIKVLSFSDR